VPLIEECLASMECAVDAREAHNLFILDTERLWIETERKA